MSLGNFFPVAISVVGAGVGAIVLWKDKIGGGRFEGNETLYGRTVIVTGATGGIGKETTKELAHRGARVIMTCRDVEECNKVKAKICDETLNSNLECMELELGSFKSIRDFADNINKNEPRLDILINNAGVMGLPEHAKTEDEIEKHLQVNYLGHFLLTRLLLDKLKKCAPSRIVNNTCSAYARAKINFEDLNTSEKYDYQVAYGQSKLALMLFTEELDNHLKDTDVQAFCTNTGLVYTDLHRHMGWYTNWFSAATAMPFYWLIMSNSNVGAQNTIHCALDSTIVDRSQENFSIFQKGCAPVKELPQYKFDAETSKRLWLTSEYWTGLREYPKSASS